MEIYRKRKKESLLKRLLPIIFGILAILEYLYFPNYDENMMASPVYLYFLLFLIALYGIFFLISFKNENIQNKLTYKAPLFAFVFVLLMAFDLLTLKLAILPLPYFAWVDRIMNSMLEDKSFLLESTLASLKLLFTGYFIGAILGIICGIFAGYSKKVDYWLDPFLKLLGPIPTTTWIPVVMVLSTSLFGGAVFIIALGVWFQTTLATMTGIKNVDSSYYEAAKTLGASEYELVTKIASPNIFQGLISAMSSACTSLIVAEMLGVESGLGWYITWKSSWADYSSMYGAIILLALNFIIVNIILKKISNRVLVWQKED